MNRLLLLLLLLPSCAWLRTAVGGNFQRPDVHFDRVRLSGWSLSGVQLDTVWSVHNPNDVSLRVKSLDYQLQVEGKRVAAGQPPEGLEIPSNQTAEIVLPATVRFADVLPAAEAILGKSQLRWKASGHAGVDTPVGVMDFPLSASGTVKVPPPDRILRRASGT